MSANARSLVEAGIKKQGAPFAGFPADLHARLYLPSDPPPQDGEPPIWASHLHSLASELGEWQRLCAMCARNGFAAGVAAEVMLSHLLPHVPDPPSPPDSDSQEQPGAEQPPKNTTGAPGEGAAPAQASTTGIEGHPSDAALRASLRKAARAARDAVQEAEAGLEGLGTPLGFSMPGTSVVANAGPANLSAIREAHTRLHDSHRLKRICELAGRLERVCAAKARATVRPCVGEIYGVEQGGDLQHLLPSELVALRHPHLRMHLLSRVLQRQALQYGMQGKATLGRGSVLVLLDESGSMRDAGMSKDIWAKAVCLALLSTATRQKRDWHLVAFNGRIRRECTVPVRTATPIAIQEALDHRCAGGTNFDHPVIRAIEIIKTSKAMKKADVVIITDGEADLEPATIEAATALTKSEGVSWFAVGVGPDAETELRSLEPIATSMVRVRDTNDHDLVAPVVNLEPNTK